VQHFQSYKFELDPNNVTVTLLRKHVGACRFVWNWALAKRIKLFEENEGKDRFSNYIEDNREINLLKKNDLSWLYEVSSTVPTQSLMNLDKAFSSFWKRRKEGIGFPKFKKKGQRDSFRIVNIHDGLRVQFHYVRLPIIGVIRTKEKNIDKRVEGRILSVTIFERCGRWFISINTMKEIEEVKQKEIFVDTSIGVDLGIKTFATFSDGTKIEPIRAFKKFEKKLKRAQRKLSKKKKGSKNREKAKKQVQKIHFDISNVRSNFIHQITSVLSRTKSAIVIENLKILEMKFQKQVRDAAFGMFRSCLTYKCSWRGTNLFVANSWFASSKLCSCCGHKHEKLKLSDREWICEKCGTHHDRDVNAAKNLLGQLENLKNVTVRNGCTVPVSCRDQRSASSSRRSSKKSVEKPLVGVQFNELNNVIVEAESEKVS
jgi:putative transposase